MLRLRPLRHLGTAGFTLAETLIAVSITAVLTGVVVSQLAKSADQGDEAAMAQNLSSVASAIQNYRGDVGRYPRNMQQLATPPASGDPDLCGRPVADMSGWRGPYLGPEASEAGLSTGNSNIEADFTRTPSTITGFTPAELTGTLYIRATAVDTALAGVINRAFEADGTLSDGSIRWSADDDGTLIYAIPIRGC